MITVFRVDGLFLSILVRVAVLSTYSRELWSAHTVDQAWFVLLSLYRVVMLSTPLPRPQCCSYVRLLGSPCSAAHRLSLEGSALVLESCFAEYSAPWSSMLQPCQVVRSSMGLRDKGSLILNFPVLPLRRRSLVSMTLPKAVSVRVLPQL